MIEIECAEVNLPAGFQFNYVNQSREYEAITDLRRVERRTVPERILTRTQQQGMVLRQGALAPHPVIGARAFVRCTSSKVPDYIARDVPPETAETICSLAQQMGLPDIVLVPDAAWLAEYVSAEGFDFCDREGRAIGADAWALLSEHMNETVFTHRQSILGRVLETRILWRGLACGDDPYPFTILGRVVNPGHRAISLEGHGVRGEHWDLFHGLRACEFEPMKQSFLELADEGACDAN